MAEVANYYPDAPSDGFGNITGKIDVTQEAKSYALRFLEEEESRSFWLGCPDFSHREALVFTVEAARSINGGAPEVAKALLKLALAELEASA
jgi:hypothetical protein